MHSVDFYEGDLRTNAPPRKWTVHLPKDWDLEQVEMSSRGDSVAWVVHTHPLSNLLMFLHRLVFPIKPASQSVTALYVSRIDGSAMREIGYVAIPSDADQDIEVSW